MNFSTPSIEGVRSPSSSGERLTSGQPTPEAGAPVLLPKEPADISKSAVKQRLSATAKSSSRAHVLTEKKKAKSTVKKS